MAKNPLGFLAILEAGGAWSDTVKVAVTFTLVLSAALLWTALESWAHAATSCIWALACLASGCTIGFLFGIPRVLQDGAPVATPVKPVGPGPGPPRTTAAGEPPPADEPHPAYRLLVNTKLERVSDWLTGIIVGLGLVHLGSIPGYVDSLAHRFASGLGNEQQQLSFAGGVIITFAVLGFFFGYP